MRTRNRSEKEEEEYSTSSSESEESESEEESEKKTIQMKLRNKNQSKNGKRQSSSSRATPLQRKSFSYQYPPSDKNEDLEDLKNIRYSTEIMRKSSDFLKNSWFAGESSVLCDSTNYVKFKVISIFMEKVKKLAKKCPPFLLITRFEEISDWINELRFWSELKFFVISTNKTERRELGNGLLFDLAGDENFDVLIITNSQFSRDSSILPSIKWSAVITDCVDENFDFENVSFHNSVLISSEKTALTEAEQNFLDTEEEEVPDDRIFSISFDDAANDFLFSESIISCPMVSSQNELYLSTLKENIEALKSEETPIEDLCSILKQLCDISSHPSLVVKNLHTQLISIAGKTGVLSRLLANERNLKRKTIIVCSKETIPIISSVFSENRISFNAFLDSDDDEAKGGKVESFHKEEVIRVLLINSEDINEVLKNTNAQTIVSYDIDWTPLESGREIVEWSSRVSNPEIYRLLATDTAEEVMFKFFWENRSNSPTSFEDPSVADINVVREIIKRTAKLAHFNLGHVKAPHRAILKDALKVSYSNLEAFKEEEEFQWDDMFWEPPEKPNQPHEDKPKVPKPLTPAQYWNEENLIQFIDVYKNFGWGRWELYEKHGRPVPELQKLWVVVTRQMIEKLDRTNYPFLSAQVKLHGKFDQKRFLSGIKGITSILAKLDQRNICRMLESWPVINKLVGDAETPENVIIPDNFINEKITKEEAQKLLFDISRQGISALEEGQKEQFLGIISAADAEYKNEILEEIAPHSSSSQNAASSSSKKAKAKPEKKIEVQDHNKILTTLLNYGFPDIDSFKASANLDGFSNEVIQEYVDKVVEYCNQPSSIGDFQLAAKIPRYQATKITQRIDFFKKIREAIYNTDDFSAEDLEFLSAVSFHGMMNQVSSPTLLCAFAGQPSETKINQKVKQILEEKKTEKVVQKMPPDIDTKMPLRINDMQMLMSMGAINPNFYNDYFVYPIGYKCAVECQSLQKTDKKVWVICQIEERRGDIVFAIHPFDCEGPRVEGQTPDEVVENYLTKISKKTSVPYTSFSGHEFFGLNSPLVNRLLLDMPGIEQCTSYKHRFFSSTITLSSRWPTIGHFEKEIEKPKPVQHHAAVAQPKPAPVKAVKVQTNKFKYKKKSFGELLPPLVLDLSSIASSKNLKYTVDIATPEDADPTTMIDYYQKWMKQEQDEFHPEQK